MTAPTDTVAALEGISRVYRTQYVRTQALSDINLSIKTGEFLALTGPSGSGKSTLLSILGLMEPASDGRLVIADHDISAMDRKARARIRGQYIGFVFQFFHLIPDLSIEDNIALPMYYAKRSASEIRQRVNELLDRLEIAHRRNHFPVQLSGGQKQRTAIARALANRPKLILADEPTGNLDTKTGDHVMDLFRQLHEEGHAICLVTHDLRHIQNANRHLELRDGRILA